MPLFRLAFSLLLFTQLILAENLVKVKRQGDQIFIQTMHGDMVVDDPLLIELIESKAMQRLKNIRQYGLSDLNHPTNPIYHRFDHSIGVMVLLAKHGAPLKTQAVGLLHDVSHTAFSHAVDPLFMGSFRKGAYQDLIHVDFLKKRGLSIILQTYGYKTEDMDPERDPMLDQPSPALCGDRLEYNLIAGVIDGNFTEADQKYMEEHLFYEDGKWFFDEIKAAKILAMNSIWETENRWGSVISTLTGIWTSEMLAEALRLRLVTIDEIQYEKSDDELLEQFEKEGNTYIKNRIKWIKNPTHYFSHTTSSKASKKLYSKFRAIDPLIKMDGEFKKLSEWDADFKSTFDAGKQRAEQGMCVVFKNGASAALELS